MNFKRDRNENSHISIILDSSNKDNSGFNLKMSKKMEEITKIQILIIIILFVFMLLVGNPLQWIAGLIILGLIGVNFFLRLQYKSRDIDIWKRKNKLDEIVHLKISRTSEVAKSAFKGKKLSQAILEEKLIDEFIKKMIDKKNLTNDDIRFLFDNPSKLKKVIGDKELSRFLLKGKSLKKVFQDQEYDVSKKRLFKAIKEDKDYKRKIERLIKKMEEWN